ncbi:hypothetical protein EYC84_008188 [Monilinia fructicola]|uniref:Uncharacterized protein n=1 Tax=Monilinia fructicola TaxID=38448 RepID=A0A5M9JG43_MONFR|nr:hypothetical protein EYC84_008188 [Monilinia fructicola]
MYAHGQSQSTLSVIVLCGTSFAKILNHAPAHSASYVRTRCRGISSVNDSHSMSLETETEPVGYSCSTNLNSRLNMHCFSGEGDLPAP